MRLFKAQSLKQLLHVEAVLLLLCVCTDAGPPFHEKRNCDELLPLPNLNADLIVVGKIVQYRPDDHAIDVVIVKKMNGTLPDVKSSNCWQLFGNAMAITISTSTLPDACGGIDDQWPHYTLSLSTGSEHACPSLAFDGVHRPVLPAYLSEEKGRIRRQSSLCKFNFIA